MSPWRSEAYVLHVRPRQAVLCRPDEATPLVESEIIREDFDVRSIESCLGAIKLRSSLRIVIDDEFSRFWQVTPPANASRLGDLRAAAQMRFEALYGETSVDWVIEADWQANKPFLACALPGTLINAISTVLNSKEYRHIRVAACQPAFVDAWNLYADHLPADETKLAVVNASSITVALVGNREIIGLKSFACQSLDPSSLEARDAEIMNFARQHGAMLSTGIALTGLVPDSWTGESTRNLTWRHPLARSMQKQVAAT